MRNSTGGWSIWANSMPPWIKEGPPGHHPEPLTPRRLDQLKSAVANFDLSSLVRRQPACALAPGMPPRPVFEEAYFSFDELRHRLLPNVHLMANRWLFQHLTCILDERMLTLLPEMETGGRLPTSININISTLASRAFSEFDRRHSRRAASGESGAKRAGRPILELQPFDIVADSSAFHFARNFVRLRNYTVCLDGLSCLQLPSVPRDLLDVGLVKLHWRAEEADAIERNHAALADSIRRFGATRVVLARCGEAAAIDFGQSVGITRFQGWHIDELLNGKSTSGANRSIS